VGNGKKAEKLLNEFPVEIVQEGLDEDTWKDAVLQMQAAWQGIQKAGEDLLKLASSEAWTADEQATKAEVKKIRAKLKEMADDIHLQGPKFLTYLEALKALEKSAKRFYKLHAKGKRV
jgi:hypothetical protein